MNSLNFIELYMLYYIKKFLNLIYKLEMSKFFILIIFGIKLRIFFHRNKILQFGFLARRFIKENNYLRVFFNSFVNKFFFSNNSTQFKLYT